MKVFAPNRKNSSRQEMGGQYLRCLSIGEPLGQSVQGSGFKVERSTAGNPIETMGKVKGNRSYLSATVEGYFPLKARL